MSAVLPFVLPALKLMTVAVGVLNNMALTGAVFTLLRNNAFTDYNHKILYVNSGYKNEMKEPVHFEEEPAPVHENYDTYYAESNAYDQGLGDFNKHEGVSLNSNWVSQYYGENGNYAGLNGIKKNDIDIPDTNETWLWLIN